MAVKQFLIICKRFVNPVISEKVHQTHITRAATRTPSPTLLRRYGAGAGAASVSGTYMANARLTKLGFLKAVQACVLLVLFPKRFQRWQEADNKLLNAQNNDINSRGRPSLVVRRALFTSLVLVLISGCVGYVAGSVTTHLIGYASQTNIIWTQIVGVSVLLWGTLFIRGFEIQTHGGITLTERVNQWIYRALYCLGTAVLVFSAAWLQS